MESAQKPTWHLKRADLENMINSNSEYTHVEVTMNGMSEGKTECIARVVKVGPVSAGRPILKASGSTPTCPVPPGCNDDPD